MGSRNNFVFVAAIIFFTLLLSCSGPPDEKHGQKKRPNILFVIADDQSYPHASVYGDHDWDTPGFDKVAKQGVLFTNAFVAAPQCSPSRAAILTGRNIWQLEEAGTHGSYFPKKFPVFTQVLESAGYRVGYTGKPWGPGNWKDTGWAQNPVGEENNSLKFDSVPTTGISKINYAANFESFLDKRSKDQPFFFWFGAQEPHRDYAYGSGRSVSGGKSIKVPPFLPTEDSIVNDLLDYALEISWFDQQLQKMISRLEESGDLENTIIVVTADNGMAFPYSKANLQEYGIHVPLAICGPFIPPDRKVDDLVSLIDLAPTLLELAGCNALSGMTGRSFVRLLTKRTEAGLDTARTFILAGRERHTHARPDNAGYPARAIRTKDFLYIRNFRPDRWPVGDPPSPDFTPRPEETDVRPVTQGYEDIDDGPSKRVMIAGRKKWPTLFNQAFTKRPEEQLYNIKEDPYCMHDLSGSTNYDDVLAILRKQLQHELVVEGDPRVLNGGDVFDTYPRFGRMRAFPGFRQRGEYAPDNP
jgi:N-sulfoglucosamine sulfohydrolase